MRQCNKGVVVMIHITDKKQIEAVIRLNERMIIAEGFKFNEKAKRFNKDLTIAMLWCITQ